MSEPYVLHGVPTVDVVVALRCEAERATTEGMAHTAKRQNELAHHMWNAQRHMQALCPRGQRVQMDVTFRLVPDVNPVLRAEIEPFHGWTVGEHNEQGA